MLPSKIKTIHEFAFGAVRTDYRELFMKWFAISLFCYVMERSRYLSEWLTVSGFHFTPDSLPPYYGSMPPLLPFWGAVLFVGVFLSAIATFVAGFLPRFMAAIILGCLLYTNSVDVVSAYTLNKLFVVVFLVHVFGPSTVKHRCGEGEQSNIVQRFESAWALRVLQSTVLLHYCVSGWCKMYFGDWLTNPDVTWTHLQGFYCTDLCAKLFMLTPKWMLTAVQFSVLVFEFFAPVLFIWRRTRLYAIAFGVLFHVSIAMLMYKLFYFSFQMVTFYLLFIEPDQWSKFGSIMWSRVRDLLPTRWNARSTAGTF